MSVFFCHTLPYVGTARRSCFLMSHLTFCSKEGKIVLPYEPPPPELLYLYTANTPQARHFQENTRSYNHVFSFTSMGVHLDTTLANGCSGVYTFRAQGTIYHKIGPLLPSTGQRPRFLQMYLYDTDHELQNRLFENETLDPHVLALLSSILDRHNAFAQVLRRISLMDNVNDIRLELKERRPDQHQYNLPTASQVAAILIGVTIKTQGGHLLNVPDTAGFYDPLQYPLLHPYGQFGWDVQLHNKFTGSFLSCRAYYCYLLQIRAPHKSLLLNSRRLLQQYVVDTYVKISTQQLRYIRDNQVKLRAELYQGLQDSIANGETCASNIGRRVILPASYIGSPRDMHERYYDAMAVVQKFGKPDLFITMTCNPKWDEIQRLPHAHLLLILDHADKLRTPADYDTIVRAEIPNKITEPDLFQLVIRHMIHGPCGKLDNEQPCMKEGNCKKFFPKAIAEFTTDGVDSYPIYRRRSNGPTVKLRNGVIVDNQWVVPYNPWLLRKYECHINVEICSTIKCVKYLYKYVYKGSDRCSMQIKDNKDEIKKFVDGRWISAQEALWRIFHFPLNKIYPAVYSQLLHLPNMHELLRNESIRKTMLTEFFYTNSIDPKATQYLYAEFPEHYTWDNKLKSWHHYSRVAVGTYRVA
ncbi:DNA helicase [Ranunculus cassubicifolius]